jgi:hypothetical protein
MSEPSGRCILASSEMRRAALPGSPEVAKFSHVDRNRINLPVVLQALRDEIRTLDRYLRKGLITQIEIDARLADWQISYPPGMYRIDELALLRASGAE